MEDPKKDESEKANPNEHSVVEEKKETSQQIPTNHKTFLLICVLLATLLAIVIPVVMLNTKSSSAAEDDGGMGMDLPDEGNETDVSPSEAPSAVGVSSRQEAILPFLENSSFGNLNTCDPRALEWLVDVDTWEPPALASDPDQMWIERYFFTCLWFATDGPNWNKKEGWMEPGTSHCDWYGDCKSITTCNTDGYVQRFCLWINNMMGTLPSQVGVLTTIALFEISTTPMTGPLPTELGALPNLLHLSLYDNDFTGSIPTELAQMTQLTTLYLDENRFSGSIPPLTFLNVTDCFLAFENPDTPNPERNCYNDTSSNPNACVIDDNCSV